MSTKTSHPDIDFGFYASVPRIVRTGYRNVTPIQKWLYTCLKDLCGDKSTCYRTLRVLSDETGISTGLLSESIPVLHEVGLIHAEKKKRQTGGKEVWHITIVDIWQSNGVTHPSKRSHAEQTTNDTDTNVHQMNENVQHVNETSRECSACERECSQIPHRSNTRINTSNEERTEKDTRESDVPTHAPSTAHADVSLSASSPSLIETPLTPQADVTAPAVSPVLCNNSSSTVTQANTSDTVAPPQVPIVTNEPQATAGQDEKKPTKPKPAMPTATAKWGTRTCMLMFDAWRGAVVIAPSRLRTASTSAKGLAENYTREQVEQVYERMSHDPYWIERGGPDIDNVASNIARELKKLERKPTPLDSKRKSSTMQQQIQEKAPDFTFLTTVELMKLPLEERKAYNARAREAMRANQQKAVNA